MPRVLVIVPFPFDESGIDNRRDQLGGAEVSPEIQFDFRGVRASPALFDSYHDWLLADAGIFEAGLEAQRDGYDAVCVDTMSDSGVNALRSVLDVPVVGPAKASYLTALMLGSKFSILTQWDPWIPESWKTLQEYGLTDKCASVRSIDVHPDVENLMVGREHELFPALLEQARACIEDGADVICLGSTTMHQAHAYLHERLDVPVINPGPLTYKLAELLLGLGLTHSRRAYRKPHVPKDRHGARDARRCGRERGDSCFFESSPFWFLARDDRRDRAMTPYPNLFSPIVIGNVTARNRLLQTGHTKLFSQAGHDTARHTAYHAERAKGGIGLIITGNRFVHPTSTSATLRYSYAWRREAIPFDRQLTNAVHEHGAVIFAQLNHFGVNGVSDAADDIRVVWDRRH